MNINFPFSASASELCPDGEERSILSPGPSLFHFRRPRGLAIVALFLLFMGCPLLVHAQSPNGALRGEVLDVTGARVPGASVAALSAASAQGRKVKADEHGEFRIEGLPPGTYQLTVTAEGFAQASAQLEVVVSTVRDVSVTLKAVTSRETVNVESKVSSITTEST